MDTAEEMDTHLCSVARNTNECIKSWAPAEYFDYGRYFNSAMIFTKHQNMARTVAFLLKCQVILIACLLPSTTVLFTVRSQPQPLGVLKEQLRQKALNTASFALAVTKTRIELAQGRACCR